ncbi:MAG TPA: class II aldolase/adducin family protein [Burkholderiales bacterium]|nr:class II aldolase/adducin family protein [Burkholderiales bacterium]HXJ50615.1 class II aldolase/adducin family protein [Burkholderiales bacterium]
MNLITSRALVDDLVVANRILAELGVLDAFGHVSVRSDADPRRYVLTRLLAPEMVTRDDLIEYDLDSRPVHDDDRKPCLERFIHGEIYKARPDVLAVVHSHAPSVIPFAASSVRLRPIYHMGAFLGRGAPVFDIRKRFGATDLLVRNPDHGRDLASILGAGAVALMRGHGFATVGESLPVAVCRAIYTELNARLQAEAIGLGGEITYLDGEESELADAVIRSVVAKPWDLWKKRALERMKNGGRT